MDKIIGDLIVGAASSGLWSMLASTGVAGAKALRYSLSKTDTASQAVEAAVETVADHFPLGAGSERATLLKFLESPELESVIRQIYAERLVGKESAPETGVEAIRQEFLRLASLHLDVSPDRITAAADPLFHTLVSACNANLTRAFGQGGLGAHEALAKHRHRRLLDELAAVQRNLAALAGRIRPDIQAVLAFEERYRQQVGLRHSQIQPPNFDSARKVPIDDLFVTPTFYSPHRRKRIKTSGAEIGIEAVAASIYRLVIVGNPGGGKSILATKLVHDMATRYDDRPVAGRRLTPILVILREYGRLKKAQNCSILQFIEVQANANYQVQPPPGAFEYLLLNGRALVVFDGLDELLDTSDRQEVSADVESFCSLYPNVPVMVTSREVGYEQAPLDEGQFALLSIAPFDEQQVARYAEKWFARDEDDPEEQRRQKAKAFLAESEVTPDLRSNPLMLGLMCNLYKVEGYIPRNRADVYEKCSIMLFERWDRGRGIVVQLRFEAHVRPAMQHLAHWIYSQASLQAGVTQDKLIEQTQEYLVTWVFDDVQEARRAAEDFVEFCTGRAWVFTDTGTTADGQKLFQFTHRTFLEYFTASYLSSVWPTPETLGEVLQPRIRKEEWDAVATLAFQIQSRRVQGAADVLLMGLLAGWTSRSELAACIAFAARCLGSIVPSPRVRRAIATAAVDFAVECGAQEWSGPVPEAPKRRRSPVQTVLRPLISASIENRATLAEVFRDRLLNKVMASEAEALAALEIALSPSAFDRGPNRPFDPEAAQYWRKVFSSVVEASRDRLRELASHDLGLCITGALYELLSIDDLLNWHGAAGLFRSRTYRCFRSVGSPYAHVLIRNLISCAVGDYPLEATASLQDGVARLGRWLLSRETPWINSAARLASNEYEYWEAALPHNEPDDELKPNNLAPDALFGAFCLFALYLELSSMHRSVISDRISGMLKQSNLVLIARMTSARSAPLTFAKLARFFNRCGLSQAHGEFIARWIDGAIDLTDAGNAVQMELLPEIPVDSDDAAPEDLDASPHDITS